MPAKAHVRLLQSLPSPEPALALSGIRSGNAMSVRRIAFGVRYGIFSHAVVKRSPCSSLAAFAVVEDM